MPSINYQGWGAEAGKVAQGVQQAQREEEVYQFEKQAAEFELNQAKQQAAQQQSQQRAAQEGAAWAIKNMGAYEAPESLQEMFSKGGVMAIGAHSAAAADYAQQEQGKIEEAQQIALRMSPAAAERFIERVSQERMGERVGFEVNRLLGDLTDGMQREVLPEDAQELTEAVKQIDPADPQAGQMLDQVRELYNDARRAKATSDFVEHRRVELIETTRGLYEFKNKTAQYNDEEMADIELAIRFFETAPIMSKRDLISASRAFEDELGQIDTENLRRRRTHGNSDAMLTEAHAIKATETELFDRGLTRDDPQWTQEYRHLLNLNRRVAGIPPPGRAPESGPGQPAPQQRPAQQNGKAARPPSKLKSLADQPKAGQRNVIRRAVRMMEAGKSEAEVRAEFEKNGWDLDTVDASLFDQVVNEVRGQAAKSAMGEKKAKQEKARRERE